MVAIQNPSALSQGSLQILDAYYDTRFKLGSSTATFSVSGYSGAQPTTIQNMPEEQVGAEVLGCLELVKIVLGTLGMNDYRVRVGLRDPDSAKYVGKPEQWDRAEKACVDAAQSLGVPFTKEPGEAAFYGPKIDFVVKDVIGVLRGEKAKYPAP